MQKISEMDSRILKHLLQDGRESFADIAKKCKLSKNKVWRRYKTLENKGIIVGATLQVNFSVLGYVALATLLLSIEAQQIDQILERLSEIREIRAYRHYNSVYNLRGFATLKDLSELDQIKETIRRKLPTRSMKTYLWTGIKNIPQNLMLSPNEKIYPEKHDTQSALRPQKQTKEIKIDELDRRIIEELTTEGRAAFSKIAQNIGTSTDTVVKRYYRLKNNGVIKVSIQIDLNRLGYQALLDFNISSISSLNLSGIIESLGQIADIIIVTKTSGDYDLQVTAAIRNVEQMFNLQEEIAKIPGISVIEASARKIPSRWPTPQQYISTY